MIEDICIRYTGALILFIRHELSYDVGRVGASRLMKWGELSYNMGRVVLDYGASRLGPSFNWGELV